MRARCRGSYLEEELERAWGEALETMCQKRYSNHGIGWTYSPAGEDMAIVRFKTRGFVFLTYMGIFRSSQHINFFGCLSKG